MAILGMSKGDKSLSAPSANTMIVRLLEKLGWEVLSPAQGLAARGGMRGRVLLETVLEERLRAINGVEYRGVRYPFTDAAVRRAVETLRDVRDDGVLAANAAVTDLLQLGTVQEQAIGDDRRSFPLRYIHWEDPEANRYHCIPEYTVAGRRHDRAPDIVLFVNGIPMAAIECKRRDRSGSLEAAVAQLVACQEREEGIPRLFWYTQMLLALQPNAARYAVPGAHPGLWAPWKEEEPAELEAALAPLLAGDAPDGGDRLPTEQDRALYALCRPERLLEFARFFTLFEAGEKKIARHQQYRAVAKTLARVRSRDAAGRRRGGVIWHTQGSGKSLTMVMLARLLLMAPDLPGARVVLVTDRVDLDDQIWRTFNACGAETVQAATGRHLLELLGDRGVRIIATVVDKFDAAFGRARRAAGRAAGGGDDAGADRDATVPAVTDAENIFVLVDEGHCSHYGAMHARMRRMLPRACMIAFTGTPLLRAEKSTAAKFGGVIDDYRIDEAVEDHAVVPLLYEGRETIFAIDRARLDRGFGRIAEPLAPYARRDLKRKAAHEPAFFKLKETVEEIAEDITRHFTETWAGTGLKAQLAAPDRFTAIRYHKYFEERGKIATAVVIAPPERPEGEAPEPEERQEVRAFWEALMERHGRDERRYEKSVIAAFKGAEGPELLIVVDKLLVGFDAPRNTVLYVTRSLREHGLLQAIARVNRPFPGKQFGFIIDYRGVLGELDRALGTYRALAGYDPEDLGRTITDVEEEIARLPDRHAAVADLFKEVPNRTDTEALQRCLFDDELRHRFYAAFAAFARTLRIALSAHDLPAGLTDERLEYYGAQAKFYGALRRAAAILYAEAVDYRTFEGRIRALMDAHVGVDRVERTIEPVNLFNLEAFEERMAEVAKSPASKADMIAAHLKRAIAERMEEDPALFEQFSAMVQQAIDDYHQKRIDEAEYLRREREARDEFLSGSFRGIPPELRNNPEGRACYGIVTRALRRAGLLVPEDRGDERDESGASDGAARIAGPLPGRVGADLAAVIDAEKSVDWRDDPDAEKRMCNAMEDYLLDLGRELGVRIDYDTIDGIMAQAISVARALG